jgi:hypothetical protein
LPACLLAVVVVVVVVVVVASVADAHANTDFDDACSEVVDYV